MYEGTPDAHILQEVRFSDNEENTYPGLVYLNNLYTEQRYAELPAGDVDTPYVQNVSEFEVSSNSAAQNESTTTDFVPTVDNTPPMEQESVDEDRTRQIQAAIATLIGGTTFLQEEIEEIMEEIKKYMLVNGIIQEAAEVYELDGTEISNADQVYELDGTEISNTDQVYELE